MATSHRDTGRPVPPVASVLPSEMAAERPREAWETPFDAAVHRDVENVQTALATVDRQVLADVVRALGSAGKTVVLSAGSYAAVGHILVDKLKVMGFDADLETRGGIHTITAMASLEQWHGATTSRHSGCASTDTIASAGA